MMTTMFLSSTATESHRDSCEIADTLEQPILADGERCLEEHCLLPDDVVTSGVAHRGAGSEKWCWDRGRDENRGAEGPMDRYAVPICGGACGGRRRRRRRPERDLFATRLA